MYEKGYYLKFNYTEEELDTIDSWLTHHKDFDLSYTQINQMESKYFVRDRVSKQTYETPRFMFARIALAVFESDSNRMFHIQNFLRYLDNLDMNLPSPNWSYIGTVRRTGASCCLYSIEDTSRSIAAANHITEMMTIAAAGLGNNYIIRSIGDSVKGGTIIHQGKQGYHKAAQGITKSNKQGSRGGALTTYVPINDPEIEIIVKARNPSTVAELKVDEIDYAFLYNRLFGTKLINDEQWMLISIKDAPDLYQAFYSNHYEEYVELYEKYELDDTVKKTFIRARDLADICLPEQYETGRLYSGDSYQINYHTPHKDPIYSSNLCLEITLPTKPFHSVKELYEEFSSEWAYILFEDSAEEEVITDIESARWALANVKVGSVVNGRIVKQIQSKNEIALCNIAGVNLHRDFTDDEYLDVCYYLLRVIDYVILNSQYEFPNVKYTAAQRMNAGVGLTNFAYELARNGLYYSSKAGKQHAHFIAERHWYMLAKASLKISKERGVAPWMFKSKFPEGWTPLDTYCRAVDNIADFEYKYDYEALSKEIIENGGLAHSSLVAHMPCESSSQVLNSVNGLYPIRRGKIVKTDGANVNVSIAPHFEELQWNYEIAWDIDTKHLVDHYAIFQKFNDQSISADFYHDFTKPNSELTKKKLYSDFLYKIKMGLKTQYYTNSKTNSEDEGSTAASCGSGGCSL